MCCTNLKYKLKQVNKLHYLSEDTHHSEFGKSFELINRSEKSVYKVTVENGLISKGIPGKRCECLFYTCPDNEVFFLELKGGDVHTDCKQLLNSIRYVRELLDLNEEKIRAILVHTCTPHRANQLIRKTSEEFRRNKLKLETFNVLNLQIAI
jgi:hypothetical protein